MKAEPIVALQTKLNFSQVLYRALDFHLPDCSIILDPTPGEKHSWKYYLTTAGGGALFPLKEFCLVFVDDNLLTFDKSRQFNFEKLDAAFVDPPYIFGHKQSGDTRREDYGGYHRSFGDIKTLMESVNHHLPAILPLEGKLFLKYTDVFSLSDRKFFHCASLWPGILNNFRVIDHYIIQHHHVSPTAWQVKERPCGIVNYTYLTVFERSE